MPSRKQRRRRQKSRRHEYEYVYVDEEGREVEVEPEDEPARPARAASKNARQPARSRGGRPIRAVPPPSWRRVVRRAAIFAPLMFILIWVFSKNSPPATRIGIALVYTLLFLPFFYLTDRVAYRSYLRKTGQPLPDRRGRKTS